MTSECYGMLLYCKRFGADNIVFSTENYFVANRFCELMSAGFGVITEKTSVLTERHGGGSIFTVSLPVKSECERVFKYFGYVGNEISRRINNAMLEDDVSVSAFLRGAFISCGSVNNPEKDYHFPLKNRPNRGLSPLDRNVTISVFKARSEQDHARGTRAARFLAAALCLFLLLAAGCTSKVVTLTEVRNPPQLRPQNVDAFGRLELSPASKLSIRGLRLDEEYEKNHNSLYETDKSHRKNP